MERHLHAERERDEANADEWESFKEKRWVSEQE